MFTKLLNKTLNILGQVTTQNSESGQLESVWTDEITNIPCRISEAPRNIKITDRNYIFSEEVYIFFIDADYDGLITKQNRIFFENKEYLIVKVATFDSIRNKHHIELYAQVYSFGGQSGVQSGVDTSVFGRKTQKVNGHELVGDINITKSDVGLGNVDNTSDLNKPISNAVQNALDQEQDIGTNYDDLKYSQAFTGNSVIVNHNLGKYPSVSVIDSAGDEVEGNVVHNSINQLTITFSASFTGTVYCN